jgi:predicted DCC family thiol-disulfide oxidoreductase YuxK
MARSAVIFDGDCGICQASVRFIRWLDWRGRFDFRAYQDTAVYQEFPQISAAACAESVHLADHRGHALCGADACRGILRRLPLTAPLAVLLAIPPLPALLRWGYPHLARRRRGLSVLLGLTACSRAAHPRSDRRAHGEFRAA